METKQQVIDAIKKHGLTHWLDTLEPLIWPSIRIRYASEQPSEFPVGVSRIGGLPDLPPGMEWPMWRGYPDRWCSPAGPLLFLAQFNMAEVAPYDVEHRLPEHGMLYFFGAIWVNSITYWKGITVDADGVDYSHELWRVLYYGGDVGMLQRTSPPPVSEELAKNEGYHGWAPDNHRFNAYALQFSIEMTLPSDTSAEPLSAQILEGKTDEEVERYNSLTEKVSPYHNVWEDGQYAPVHRMLGYPQVSEVGATGNTTVSLLQLDSDLSTHALPDDFSWEFSARGYFFISPEALARCDFSQIDLQWMTP